MDTPGRVLELSAVAVVVALLLGQSLGHPVLLGFVETGSMSPTLDPGDGFVAVPAAIGGPVETGDVVVYSAEEVQGGGLVTHRVIDETDRGYVTKGDANAFTDQDDGEPPVRRAQVVARALQVGGHVVTIPHLGDAVGAIRSLLRTVQRTLSALLGTSLVLGTRGLAYILFAVTLAWYAVGAWLARNERDERRTRSRDDGTDARLVVGLSALLLVAGATAAMTLPAGTQEYGVVSAEFESERATVIPAGGSASVEQPLRNGGVLPIVVYTEPASDGVGVVPRRSSLASGERTTATVTLQAPGETGYYRRYVSRHVYLAVLPVSAIDALYGVHPWAPVVAIDALVGVPFYLVGVWLVGTGRVKNRSRDREIPVTTRIRRAFRRRY
jgi:signal peptidase